MAANRVKEIWAGGGTVCNGWLGIPDGVPAEFMAHQGWDSITIDCQHGLVELDAALPMLALAPRPGQHWLLERQRCPPAPWQPGSAAWEAPVPSQRGQLLAGQSRGPS